MQAKTRSAPRTPSLCRRSIQSPTRFGSSRSTSAQSPTPALFGAGRQMRWTLWREPRYRGALVVCLISVAMAMSR